MALKRYSPKAAARYLRGWVKKANGQYFGLFATINDKPGLVALDQALEVEVLKWAEHIKDVSPTKGVLLDILKIKRAHFWGLHCDRKIDINNGYVQVLSGRTKPGLYAEWYALEVVDNMLGYT